MADTQLIPGTQVEVKPANPVAVGFLSLTLVYVPFFWYRINRELKELGEARGWELGSSPGTSAAAMFPGILVIVPSYVTSYTTTERVKNAQIYTGRKDWMEGWIGLLMWFLLPPLTLAFAQDQLNKVWQNLGVATPYEKEAMLPPAPPMGPGGYPAAPQQYGQQQPYGPPPGYAAPPAGPEAQPPPPGHRPPDAPPPT